jgi:Fur family zinc uptake transcriptional regulator
MPRSSGLRARHDHAACQREALRTAEQVCEERGLSLTPTRRQVLEIIWGSHEPIGAYEILSRMPRTDRMPAPMTVYRALDFLVSAGLAHRLDSLNAFVGCPHAADDHAGPLLVCRSCQHVDEITGEAAARAIRRAAAEFGFVPDAPFEVKGLCSDCAAQGEAAVPLAAAGGTSPDRPAKARRRS